MRKISLPKYECLRCGHVWFPRTPKEPEVCGFCKTPYWNIQPMNESITWRRHQQECKACQQK